MSKHEVKVVALPAIDKHPNADTLGLVDIDGYTVVVKLDQWKEGDLAVYIEPDYVVPETPQFAFLGRHRRIKVKKLRGVYSQGLLLPLAEFPELSGRMLWDEGVCDEPIVQAGDDVMAQLGITRWEPEAHEPRTNTGAKAVYDAPAEVRAIPKYDLENLRKNRGAFVDGERVIVTEKIHGCNARYTFRDGKMWLGSRTRWVEDDGQNVWSQALRACPWIEEQCRRVPGAVAFGEVYGQVQDLKYGIPNGVSFRMFDYMPPATGTFADAEFLIESLDVFGTHDYFVPVLYDGPFSMELMLELAEGQSTLPGANHVREGIVVKPAVEREQRGVGRVALKLVGNGYYSRKGAD